MRTRINAVYDNLSKTDKRIAKFLMDNENEVLLSTIQQTAESIGVSPSSVSRFVNKVFGKSYADFKIELAKNIENNELKKASDIMGWATKYEEMPTKIVYNIDKICQKVISYNGIEKFEEIVEKIYEANTVYVYGVGNSGIVAQDLCQKLLKLKKKTIYLIDSNFGLFSSIIATPKDLVISISVSGKTKEPIISAKKAKKSGVKVVAITSDPLSELAKIADYPIIIPNVENSSFRIGAIFSRYAMLFAVDMLFIGLSKKTTNNINEYLEEYHSLFNEYKNGVKNVE